MPFLEPKEICEVVNPSEDEMNLFDQSSDAVAITILPEPLGEKGEMLFSSDSGEFAKWIKNKNPSLSVEFNRSQDLMVRRANDIWLPLVKLAGEVSLAVFLGVISNFLYDMMKGALKADSQRIHLSILYKDEKNKKLKKFKFEGDAKALKDAIKKVDLNEFADK
jgi:hypothetical protein